MPGDHRRAPVRLGKPVEPALQRAVHHRRQPPEQQIAREQRPRGAVAHGQVAVGMGAGGGGQFQGPAAEVQHLRPRDGPGRADQDRARPGIRTDLGGDAFGPGVAAKLQRLGQAGVGDDLGAGFGEDLGARDMVGVHVGQHHGADGLVGQAADGGVKRLALRARSAGVDHRHAVPAQDDAEVGDPAPVVGGKLRVGAAIHVDARSDLGKLKRRGLGQGRAAPVPAGQVGMGGQPRGGGLPGQSLAGAHVRGLGRRQQPVRASRRIGSKAGRQDQDMHGRASLPEG